MEVGLNTTAPQPASAQAEPPQAATAAPGAERGEAAGAETARRVPPGQAAQDLRADLADRGADLPKNAQGLLASGFARGADAETLFQAFAPASAADEPAPAPVDPAPVAEQTTGTPQDDAQIAIDLLTGGERES